ncbi:hypothetical protein J3A83DRAFT_4358899 [Scleroderma citrinum]
MRLCGFAPLSLLTVVSGVLCSQVPLNSPLTVQSTTLVDILNADDDYTLLRSLLQRTRLIPTLNKLNGSTLFAPTNEAVKRRSDKDALLQRVLEDDSLQLPDNVQEQLREQLLYHLLNYTITTPEDSTTQTLKTLHFPKSPAHETPVPPPWLPIPEGTLGGDPQRVRLALRDDSLWLGTDAFGQGGVQVVKPRVNASNGVVYGISDMLDVPPNLAQVIVNNESLSYLQKILTPNLKDFLNRTSEVTLFIPVDVAWKSLDPLERLYLESDFAEDDRQQILNMHSVVERHVKWSDSFESSTKFTVTTEYGSVLDIEVSSNGTTISGANLVQPDIYASNGVLHLVSTLLIPPGALKLTPEKYLLALNCSSFISLLHSVNLTHLVNNSDQQYTILAPKDDVLSIFASDGLPKAGSKELKRMLEYHFLPGLWTPKKLEHGGLLETELREPGLDDGRQVLQIEVHMDEKLVADSNHITFGGAGIIGEHVELDNTVIYFISRPLDPPVDPLQTALPSLDLSSFLAAVFSTSLADVIKKTPRTTFLIPRNSAFKRLGLLVSDHLLAASSKTDLENVILHHVIDNVEYSKSLVNGSQRTFATLEGSDLQLGRTENGSVVVHASGGWTGMKSALYPQNTLTETGVIHEVSDLMIPRTVELNVGKLVKAAKAITMANIVVKAGFDWILNGTTPPEDSEWEGKGLDGASWTFLCPTDDAFKKLNLTQFMEDPVLLRSIVKQHLIPTPPSLFVASGTPDLVDNNRPFPLHDLGTYSTLLSPSSAYGDLVFRVLEDKTTDEYMVGIKGARGTDGKADWARVLSWGRTTTGGGTGGVIQIDRLLMPYHPPWWIEYGPPVFVGVVGVALVCLFFYGVRIGKDVQLVEDTRSSAIENVKSFIAGGFGGVSVVLVGHPFDLTKTRLQTAVPGQYTGAIDVVRKTIARDGVTGMYRGIVPPLLGVTPIFAVSFWAYDASKKLILALTPNRLSDKLSTAELATAGFLSAVPTTLVAGPVERAKVVLQVQGQGTPGTQYKGVFDALGHLYREGGLRSIFRGTGATLIRDGPGSAAYFAAYEVTKKFLSSRDPTSTDLNLGAIILAGGTAGVAMWSLAIPPDVIKSRLQSAPTGTYSGFFDCFRKTVAQEGVAALWKGFGPAMARAFPANAATFLGVEASRKVLDIGKTSRTRTGHQRAYSASEALLSDRLARNTHNFETWSTYQHCEQASLTDLPDEFKDDMIQTFHMKGRISQCWIDKPEGCSSGLAAFLRSALEASPKLFSSANSTEDGAILEDVVSVYHAWKRLRKMRASKEKWSEADYVANVYNAVRSPAVQESVYRVQCPISLPQPLWDTADPPNTDVCRVLSTKSAIPDCAIFLPSSLTRALSQSSKSPYKILKNHPTIVKAGTTVRGSSFRYQSTPCTQLPDMPGFEFISSLWEDKKPIHTHADDAYRQNRIATASAVRHLHSLNVKSPVIGLIWANGTVRAHIDWCQMEDGKLTVLSAPYSGFDKDSQSSQPFLEWDLNNPSDILQVYYLVRNIDHWTCTEFRKRVVAGLDSSVESITRGDGPYHPWKWITNPAHAAPSVKVLKENNTTSVTTATTSGSPSPPTNKSRHKRRR